MNSKLTVIALLLGLGLTAQINPSLAQTTPPFVPGTQTPRVNTPVSSGSFFAPIESVAKQVNEFIGDIGGFVQNELFGTLNQILSSSLGAIKLPDLSQVSSQIMKAPTSSTEGTKLSDLLETKSSQLDGKGSYTIMSEFNGQAQRNAAIGIANGSTLSQQAQTNSRQILEATKQNTQQNVQLGEESQSLDVTQHILQNLSQQTALNAQVNERILLEAQQGRTDRAINNVLLSQAAKEISAINTGDRRGSIASGNQASVQAGMLMLPGGGYLGKPSESTTNRFTNSN
ncbi:hypothetical protein NIES2119_18215 [[Phormidium ambiguum] IAM M-71]|uniref:Conjugal transfer protein n=1 Tax=[Phormidium ambiguum] IAM M-71 TaxID=454136 RepID=A0A1U7IGV6_9CYAN|nr:hypothetical protein [Phormidium ambiguum]OKH36235.1 hypothetical protein NIES2119_18215 [Phormidium ambiguum IAM M-71]